MTLGPKADVNNPGNPRGAETRMKTGGKGGLAPLTGPDDKGCSEYSSSDADSEQRLPKLRDKLTLRMEYPEFQSSNTR